MAYKKLSEATFVENIMDTANVLIEENDEIKRVPENVIGRVKTVNGTKADENGNVEITTSWNDLEDRPFGVSEVVKVPVLAEQTLSFAKASDTDPIAVVILDIVIEEGKTYEVVFDGETYQCDSVPLQAVIAMGNMSLADASFENTNEPFIISYMPDNGRCMMGAAEGDHTVSIAMIDEQVKKIDEKYLPTTGGMMRVNISDSATYGTVPSFIADKTYVEIADSINNGIMPYIVFNRMIFQLTSSYAISAASTFDSVAKVHRFIGFDGLYMTNITIDEYDAVEITDYELQQVTYGS